MIKTTKYYAVKKGRKVGVYLSWDSCKEQVEGYKGAEFKSFTDLDKAYDYISEDIARGIFSNVVKEVKEETEDKTTTTTNPTLDPSKLPNDIVVDIITVENVLSGKVLKRLKDLSNKEVEDLIELQKW